MITIGKPYIVYKDDYVRLCSELFFHQESRKEIIWIEVDKQYEKFLCTERSDAFLVAVLPYAMQNNQDITCITPVTEEIHYNLSTYLIPSLAKHSDYLYMTQIYSDLSGTLKNNGAVGTGCSCGVDSMHAILNNYNTKYKSMKLTHLCLFYASVHNEKNDIIFAEQIRRATKVAEELQLSLVISNTNCSNIMPVAEDYNYLFTFSAMFVVFALQKLWKIYYYASVGKDLNSFTIEDAHIIDCELYDYLTLNSVSTSSLRVYSEGCTNTRFEKIANIADFSIAKKYLKVCHHHAGNCSKCPKCSGTMMTLDAVNRLDEFRSVFDVNYYYENKDEYLIWLFKQSRLGDYRLGEDDVSSLYDMFREEELIKDLVHNDSRWGKILCGTGLYEDGWLKSEFKAISKGGNAGKMVVSVYIPDIIKQTQVQFVIDGVLQCEHMLDEGIYEVELVVPRNRKFKWEMFFSKSINPHKEGLGDDVRNLCAILSKIELL